MKNYDLEELEQLVIEWAKQRGLLDNPSQARLTAQFGKTIEELAELEQAIDDNNLDAIKDAIGDIAVTLIIRQALLVKLGTAQDDFDDDLNLCDLDTAGAFTRTKRGLRHELSRLMESDNAGSEALWTLHGISWSFAKTGLNECLNHAYNQIKDRTGRMINNQFVKDK